jgi:hypothetical protein
MLQYHSIIKTLLVLITVSFTIPVKAQKIDTFRISCPNTEILPVKPDTSLKAVVGNMSGGIVFADSLFLIADKLHCSDTSYKIISFTLSMNVKGDLIEENINGDMYTAQTIKNLNNMTGDKIYFTNIRVKSPDGNTVKLKSIIFTLK